MHARERKKEERVNPATPSCQPLISLPPSSAKLLENEFVGTASHLSWTYWPGGLSTHPHIPGQACVWRSLRVSTWPNLVTSSRSSSCGGLDQPSDGFRVLATLPPEVTSWPCDIQYISTLMTMNLRCLLWWVECSRTCHLGQVGWKLLFMSSTSLRIF